MDEAHLLDLECFSFLNRALESELAPLLVLATNRGYTEIRGTNVKGAHGFPEDMLDRLIIVSTSSYASDEIREILRIRCNEEDIEASEDAIEKVTEIGQSTSLRYVLRLISAASLAARKRRSEVIDVSDVEKVYELFFDSKRSAGLLQTGESGMQI